MFRALAAGAQRVRAPIAALLATAPLAALICSAVPVAAQAEIVGKFYLLPKTTSVLPNFSTLSPQHTLRQQVLDFPNGACQRNLFGQGDRITHYGVVFTTEFSAGTAGTYKFRLYSDDGSRLFIDGKKIIDNDGVHPAYNLSADVVLTRGRHHAKIEFFQGPCAEFALQLFWQPPGAQEVFFPRQATAGNLRVIPRLIERLKEERSRAGPRRPTAAAVSLTYTDDDLARLRRSLEGLGLSDADWTYLIGQHFQSGGGFDASKWDAFLNYATRAKIGNNSRQLRRLHNRKLRDDLNLPQAAIDYVDGLFFYNETLRDRTVSRLYNDLYDLFLTDTLSRPDASLDAKLDFRARKRLRQAFPRAPRPSGPSIRAWRPGDRLVDCSFSAILQRMRTADPSFAQNWDRYVVRNTFLFLIAPGATRGGGAATKRSWLIYAVRDAVARCEQGRL